MADDADRAADLQAAEISHSLAHHAMRHTGPERSSCADCGAALNVTRRALRAQRCVECQGYEESRARQYARAR